MDVDFDPKKDAANIAKHGVSFADFAGFDEEPIVLIDDREDYGEVRYRAFGKIGDDPYVVVYTTLGDRLRLISFRRSNAKEGRQYDRRRQAR